MNQSDHKLQISLDGSHTVFSTKFDQTFHNIKGAITENCYVFFERSGLIDALNRSHNIRILEIGFGTGLNLLILSDLLASRSNKPRIIFQTVEAYPLSSELAAQLNYSEFLSDDSVSSQLSDIFRNLKPGQNIVRLENIELRFFYGFFRDLNIADFDADFILFDAFSPKANPELWTSDAFKKLRLLSSPDVIMTTYSAAVESRAAMAHAGWLVARAPGILGKREMTIAALSPDNLQGYKRVNETRLSKRYETGEFS